MFLLKCDQKLFVLQQYKAQVQSDFDGFTGIILKDGYILEQIPKSSLTPKVCLAAIYQTPSALKFVPQDIRDQIRDLAIEEINNFLKVKQLSSLVCHFFIDFKQ